MEVDRLRGHGVCRVLELDGHVGCCREELICAWEAVDVVTMKDVREERDGQHTARADSRSRSEEDTTANGWEAMGGMGELRGGDLASF